MIMIIIPHHLLAMRTVARRMKRIIHFQKEPRCALLASGNFNISSLPFNKFLFLSVFWHGMLDGFDTKLKREKKLKITDFPSFSLLSLKVLYVILCFFVGDKGR